MDTSDFLWDRDIPAARFRRVVNDAQHPRHDAWLALLLREARPADVWSWTTPQHVGEHLERLAPKLHRKRGLWLGLFEAWRGFGLLP